MARSFLSEISGSKNYPDHIVMQRFLLVLIFSVVCPCLYAQHAGTELRFNHPASTFEEASPLGNGRLGALDYGGTDTARIALNEISLWSGGPQPGDRDSAFTYLKPIQNLLLEGKNREAQQLLQQHFIARDLGSNRGNGANEKFGCYQTAGDLNIIWLNGKEKITDYQRILDIENAVSTTSFTRNGVVYTQESITDFANDVIRINLRSSQKKALNLALSLSRKENAGSSASQDAVTMQGQLPSGRDKGMEFMVKAVPAKTDGRIDVINDKLEIRDATHCEVIISALTNFDYQNWSLKQTNLAAECQKAIAHARHQNFAQAAKSHTAIYQKLFNRCRFRINATSATDQLTTEQRLTRYANNEPDPQLPVLYFNFGRYLLICSSRPGLLPANLQGLWATEYQTPWNGDYHININLQMNYWLSEPANLSDIAEPLFRYTRSLVPNGRKTAKAYYAADGWVAHVISNPWLFTSPGEGAEWGSTVTGGAWLCLQLWEHYLYTRDTAFLRLYNPVIKESAQFLQSILVKERTHGWLVTAPSNSPENAYIMPDGFRGQTCMGPTMDMQICRFVFAASAASARILSDDTAFATQMEELIPKLAPDRAGAAGDLNEWLDDWADAEAQHRHVSHLFGLHPFDEITPWDSPELAKAANETLRQRGDGGTGWSKAWKISFWSRLGNGDHAFLLLKQLLRPVENSSGGTYPNLLCAHPPFQIDGNFGGTAGIAEMLLQSHGKKNVIRFLPALPRHPDWKEGSVEGMMARGGYETSFRWSEGKLTNASIINKNFTDVVNVLLPQGMTISDSTGQIIVEAADSTTMVSFTAIKSVKYHLHQ